MGRTTLGGMVACALALAAVALLPVHHDPPPSPEESAPRVTVASASWSRPASTRALVRDSEAVVRGTVTAVADGPRSAAKGHARAFMPTLRVRVHVADILAGKAPSSVTLAQIGGTAPDGSTMSVEGDPIYREGEDVVLFLHAAAPGLYYANPDGRLDVVGGRTRSLMETGVGHALSGLTVAELKDRIR